MSGRPIKVLLIEDNPGDARLIQEALKEAGAAKFELTHLELFNKALKQLDEEAFDVILTDLGLPDSQGLETLSRVRAQAPEVPIVVLTGLADETLGIKAVQRGAQDYLIKGHVDSNLLARSLCYAIERKKAEEELKESDERFRIALMNSKVTVFNQDTDLRYTWVYNPHTALSQETVIGRTDADLVSPEDAEYMTKIKRRVIENGIGTHEIIRFTVGGQLSFYDLTLEPLRDAENNIVGIIGSSLDITDHKRMEDILRESEERYSKAAKIGRFGHWDWNFVEDRVIWSGEAYSIFGVDPDQFSPSYEDFVDLIHPDDKDHFESKIKASVLDNFPLDVEYRIICPNGVIKYVHSVGEVRYDKKGKPTRLVGTIQDTTERKGTEKALKRYSEDLKESNRLKDLFIDIMRHDLLNPAGAARSMTDLALKNETDPEKKEILQIIHSSTGRIIDLVENASILAALESGETLEFKETDLGDLLRKAAKEMKHQAEEKNVKIRISVEGVFKAQANPLIYDVFTNLIGNAIKYGAENSEVVAKIKENGSGWKISVADNGEGIPDEYKKGVFDRFKRVKKEGVKGTGLGLAIVKKVVEAHNGSVWVEDNPGGGSIFYVTLPKFKHSSKG